MKRKAIVLGGGRVGATIAADLHGDFDVTVADVRPDAVAEIAKRHDVTGVRADLASPDRVKELVAEHDFVVNALPSAIGHQSLRAVLDAGKPCCDITFMPEDPGDLDAIARTRGVTAIVDIGVAPGTSNVIAGWAAAHMAPCTRLELMVGGVPVLRQPPFEFKVAFAPSDVLEEYTRPARFVRGGRVVTAEPLSDVELVDVPGAGTLEAFLTDGLRTLIRTLDVPDMVEKTMRWPGHAALMRVFRDAGFFRTEPIAVGDARVRPIDVTSALVFPHWTYAPGEADLTVARIVADGTENGARVRRTFLLVDRHDPETDTRSMSRTTGFPAAIALRMIADGRFARPGVHPPEILGREPGLLDELLRELARRGVRYETTVAPLPA